MEACLQIRWRLWRQFSTQTLSCKKKGFYDLYSNMGITMAWRLHSLHSLHSIGVTCMPVTADMASVERSSARWC